MFYNFQKKQQNIMIIDNHTNNDILLRLSNEIQSYGVFKKNKLKKILKLLVNIIKRLGFIYFYNIFIEKKC